MIRPQLHSERVRMCHRVHQTPRKATMMRRVESKAYTAWYPQCDECSKAKCPDKSVVTEKITRL